MKRWVYLICMIAAVVGGPVSAQESIPTRELRVLLDNALDYLRAQQGESGSFGTVQPHLQSSLALLALLSHGLDREDDRRRVERGVRYLLGAATRSGDLGDDEFRVESHSLALTALLCALPHLTDEALAKETAEMVSRALRMTQRMQDRSSAGDSRGGWKMEGLKGRENDRRSSAWALLSYHAGILYGLEVPEGNLERGMRFLLASHRTESDRVDQIGGFSVDTQGLAVASVSAMGAWVMATMQADPDKLASAVAWLERNPPVWSGPNYFYTNFFRLRALRFAAPPGEPFAKAMRRVYLQVKDHQLPGGAVDFPPGNAQNTVAMGAVFSTSLAILMLNVESSCLPFDQDWRPPPLVQAP